MKLELPGELYELAQRVKGCGAALYVVGGAVRNALLGYDYSDIDVCSELLPEKIEELCGGLEIKCSTVNKWLGTVKLGIESNEVEYTAFRKESYPKDGSHEPIEVKTGVDIKEDAFRRDFSVNALYYDILSGEISDPTSKGLADLKRKTLSTTTENPEDIIEDDALRMLRFCRLCAELGFFADKKTADAIRKNADKIFHISEERIYSELCKILLSDEKYSAPKAGVMRGLKLLNGCGLFKRIFPEFLRAEEIGKSVYHKHNVLYHSFDVCAHMPLELSMRFSGLLHDIGKCEAYFKNGNMHNHEVIGEELSYNRLISLKAPKKLAKTVSETVRYHMFDLTGTAKDVTVRAHAVKMGEEQFLRLITMRAADVYGSGRYTEGEIYTVNKFKRIYAEMKREGAPFTLKELNISGKDLEEAGIAKGKQIGIVLNRLLIAAAKRPKVNKKERLINLARGMKV